MFLNVRCTSPDMSSKPLVVISDSSMKYDDRPVDKGTMLSYCGHHTSFVIQSDDLPSATAVNIAESIRRMSADTYTDRASGAHWGFTCPLLVVWNFNELCNWSSQGMKPLDECRTLVDEGCEMICKAVLDKP
eukprot:3317942-Amphidinium_carterae.1